MLFLKTTYLEHFSFVDFDYIQFLKLNTIFLSFFAMLENLVISLSAVKIHQRFFKNIFFSIENAFITDYTVSLQWRQLRITYIFWQPGTPSHIFMNFVNRQLLFRFLQEPFFWWLMIITTRQYDHYHYPPSKYWNLIITILTLNSNAAASLNT